MFPEFDLNVVRVSVTVLLFFATSCSLTWGQSQLHLHSRTNSNPFYSPQLTFNHCVHVFVCYVKHIEFTRNEICYINNNAIAVIRTHAARNRSTSNTFNCWKCFTHDSPLACCEVFWALCVRVRIRHSKDRLTCTSQLLKQNLPWRNRQWCKPQSQHSCVVEIK